MPEKTAASRELSQVMIGQMRDVRQRMLMRSGPTMPPGAMCEETACDFCDENAPADELELVRVSGKTITVCGACRGDAADSRAHRLGR